MKNVFTRLSFMAIVFAILFVCAQDAEAGIFKRGKRGGCNGCTGGCANVGGGRFAPAPAVQCGDGTCQPRSFSMFVPNVVPQQMPACKNGVCPTAPATIRAR